MLGNGISDGVGIGYAKTIENVQTTYTVVDIGTPDEEKSRLSGGIEKLLLKIKSGNNLSLNKEQNGSMKKVSIPWFAIGFLAVIGFNSFDLLPQSLTAFINNVDTFLLTMAMTALGAETSIDKFRKAGAKPFVLASILYIWLIAGGYFLVKYMAPIFM